MADTSPPQPVVEPPARPRQVLNVPTGYHDNGEVHQDLSPAHLRRLLAKAGHSERRLFAVARLVAVEPGEHPTRGTYTLIRAADQRGRECNFLAQGKAAPLVRYLEKRYEAKQPAYLRARPFQRRNGEIVLLNPEPVTARWVGRIEPEYEIHHQTLAAQYRAVEDLEPGSYLGITRSQSILRHQYSYYLSEVAQSAATKLLTDSLKTPQAVAAALGHEHVVSPRPEIHRLIETLHAPRSLKHAQQAQDKLVHIAAVGMLCDPIRESVSERNTAKRRRKKPPRLTDTQRAKGLDKYAAELASRILPFKLTEDQSAAVVDALRDMDSGVPMRRILSGDVGSGKTAVFTVITAAALEAGMRVAIINPTEQLARQTYGKLREWLAEFKVAFCAAGVPIDREARCLVGTVALCTKMPGQFELCVIDEQHRFARRQRDILLANRGHQLEASATCIPRSQALVTTGVMHVSYLTHIHVEKNIITRIWQPDEKGALFAAIRKTVEDGGQVLIIHPAKQASAPAPDIEEAEQETPEQRCEREADLLADDVPEPAPGAEEAERRRRRFQYKLMSVADVADGWKEAFPGQVRVAHGGLSAEENGAAIDDLHAGRANILITTSLVEVGLDIPGVRRAVIMQADRFGIAATHQLRGRVARAGGTGYCDLYVADEISPKSMRRLEVLERCCDGFELATADMDQRGRGDLTTYGNRQSGELPGNPFRQIEVPAKALETASKALIECYEGRYAARYAFDALTPEAAQALKERANAPKKKATKKKRSAKPRKRRPTASA